MVRDGMDPALPDEGEEECTHPHNFNDGWSRFKAEVIDKSATPLDDGEVASIKYPFVMGYLQALLIVAHMCQMGSAMAEMVLSLLLADANKAADSAYLGLPDSRTTEQAAPAGATRH